MGVASRLSLQEWGLVLPPAGHQEEVGRRQGFWEQQPLAGTTLPSPLSPS